MTDLTPYDTGEALEPHDRTEAADHESYGLIELTDDESRPVLSVQALRADDPDGAGYTLNVVAFGPDRVQITLDSEQDAVLTMAPELLEKLFDLAERGHEDFMHQARYGDYSDHEVAQVEQSWSEIQKIIGRS